MEGAGAVVGGTAAPDGFVHAMHVLAAAGAAIWLGVAVLVGWTVEKARAVDPSPQVD